MGQVPNGKDDCVRVMDLMFPLAFLFFSPRYPLPRPLLSSTKTNNGEADILRGFYAVIRSDAHGRQRQLKMTTPYEDPNKGALRIRRLLMETQRQVTTPCVYREEPRFTSLFPIAILSIVHVLGEKLVLPRKTRIYFLISNCHTLFRPRAW